MGFLRIGWQNYFNIMIFLLKYTYILICMWRNVRYNFFDFCLGSTAMCGLLKPNWDNWEKKTQLRAESADQFQLTNVQGTGQLKWKKVWNEYLVKLSENFWKILSLSNSNFSDWKIKIKEKYKLWIVFDKVLQWVQYFYENFKLNLSFWLQ